MVPLVLSLVLTPDQVFDSSLEDLSQIVTGITQNYHPQVTHSLYDLEKTPNRVLVLYRPQVKESPLQVTPEEDVLIRESHPLRRYYGYRWVSGNPLLYFVLDHYHRKVARIPLEDVLVDHGLVLIRGTDQLVLELRNYLLKIKSDGYFTPRIKAIRFRTLDPVHASAYLELAKVFSSEMVSYLNPTVLRTQLGRSDLSVQSPESWFREAVPRVIEGQLPLFPLVLPEKTLEEYRETYRVLFSRYPFLSYYQDQISASPSNGSGERIVHLPLGSYTQVLEYKKSFNSYLRALPRSKRTFNLGGYFRVVEKDSQIASIGLMLKSSDLVPIPEYNNFLNPYQITQTQQYRLIYPQVNFPVGKIEEKISDLNQRWRSGELLTYWGWNFYLETGKLSRFSLRKDKI